jgi:hypothetical protein
MSINLRQGGTYANIVDDPIVQMRSEDIFQQARKDYSRRSVSFVVLLLIAFAAFFSALILLFTGVELVKKEASFAHKMIEYSVQVQIAQNIAGSQQSKSSASGLAASKVNESNVNYLPKVFSSSLIFVSVLASMFVAAAVTCALAASKIFPAPAQDKASEQSSEITIPVLNTALELVKLISDIGKK